MDQQNNNRKRKDLRQILKEPKLKHKNDPVICEKYRFREESNVPRRSGYLPLLSTGSFRK